MIYSIKLKQISPHSVLSAGLASLLAQCNQSWLDVSFTCCPWIFQTARWVRWTLAYAASFARNVFPNSPFLSGSARQTHTYLPSLFIGHLHFETFTQTPQAELATLSFSLWFYTLYELLITASLLLVCLHVSLSIFRLWAFQWQGCHCVLFLLLPWRCGVAHTC